MLGRLNHVAIAVPDLAAAAAQYRDMLGAEVSAVADQPEHGVQTVFVTLRRLIGGDISMRALSGPIGIAQASREAVQGLRTFFSFLAFISLQLGIINLLPIPVLDGGHILILGVEGILRRDLSMRIKERVMQVGLVFLLLVFGFVIYFDAIKAGLGEAVQRLFSH